MSGKETPPSPPPSLLFMAHMREANLSIKSKYGRNFRAREIWPSGIKSVFSRLKFKSKKSLFRPQRGGGVKKKFKGNSLFKKKSLHIK